MQSFEEALALSNAFQTLIRANHPNHRVPYQIYYQMLLSKRFTPQDFAIFTLNRIQFSTTSVNRFRKGSSFSGSWNSLSYGFSSTPIRVIGSSARRNQSCPEIACDLRNSINQTRMLSEIQLPMPLSSNWQIPDLPDFVIDGLVQLWVLFGQ